MSGRDLLDLDYQLYSLKVYLGYALCALQYELLMLNVEQGMFNFEVFPHSIILNFILDIQYYIQFLCPMRHALCDVLSARLCYEL